VDLDYSDPRAESCLCDTGAALPSLDALMQPSARQGRQHQAAFSACYSLGMLVEDARALQVAGTCLPDSLPMACKSIDHRYAPASTSSAYGGFLTGRFIVALSAGAASGRRAHPAALSRGGGLQTLSFS
jgi:hypothetical protein